jgi:uncharacterized protein YkwD
MHKSSTPGAVVGTLAIVVVTLLGAAGTASADIVAPRAQCAASGNEDAGEPAQEDAMRCLINYARQHAGGGGVGTDNRLERAAGRKVGDVVDCGFSHTACGNPADLYPRRFGYTSARSFQFGENLAWGKGKRGSARNVLQAWLNSPGHRSTMLHGSFDDLGIGLRTHNGNAFWVLQLGCQGC